MDLSQVQTRLRSLSTHLSPLTECAGRFLQFGANLENSTITIAPMSWIAPRAHAFWIYEPLDRAAIHEDVECPSWYSDVLEQMNGCYAFGFALYGVPSPSGLLNRTMLRPLSLDMANRSWRKEYKLASPGFLFGGAKLTYSENVGYFAVNDHIASVRNNGQLAGSWPTFRAFLFDELVRAESLAREHPEARKQWG